MTSRPIALSVRNALSVSGQASHESLIENRQKTISDEELVSRIEHGDEEAFEILFDRYFLLVRSIAKRMLRGFEDDASDVAQDTFMEALQGLRTFDPSKSSFKNWISYVAYHRSLEVFKVLKKKQAESIDPDRALPILSKERLPERWIRSIDFRRSLSVVLSNLKEDQRNVLELQYFEGLAPDEIASRLGKPIGNVYHYMYRGLSKLRSELVRKGLLDSYTEFADRTRK